jgi:hypothetical protein
MKKVNFIYQTNNGQVEIQLVDTVTGKVQWLYWDKYPGQLPKLGETF